MATIPEVPTVVVVKPQAATARDPIPLANLREAVFDQSIDASDFGSTAEAIAEKLSKRKTGHHMPDDVKEALDAAMNAAGELEWALDNWCDELDAQLDQ